MTGTGGSLMAVLLLYKEDRLLFRMVAGMDVVWPGVGGNCGPRRRGVAVTLTPRANGSIFLVFEFFPI